MFRQEVNRKTVLIVLAGVLGVVALGFIGYSSYQNKSSESLVAKRDWQVNREMGIPLSMEPAADLSPEEKKQARKAALEQSQWSGQSEVDNTAASPVQ